MPAPQPITPTNANQLTVFHYLASGWIAQLAWSRNGLLACARAGGVAIWPNLNKPSLFIKQHNGPVKGIAFHPDGPFFASASADTTVKLWDLRAFSPAMQPVRVYTHHSGSVERVVIAPSDATPQGVIITAGAAGTLWFAEGDKLARLDAHTDEISALALDPQGKRLASASRDHVVRVWDVASRELLTTFDGHTGWVRDAQFHPHDDVLMSCGRDGTVRLWSVANGEQTAAYSFPGDVRAAALDPSGKVLAAGLEDGTITLLNVSSGAVITQLEKHTKPVVALAFHPTTGVLASGGGDNFIYLWGLVTS
jgi:WD40 repeat protein